MGTKPTESIPLLLGTQSFYGLAGVIQANPYEGGYAAARLCNGKELGCSVRSTPAVAVGRVRP
jgi:hypothetical protein